MGAIYKLLSNVMLGFHIPPLYNFSFRWHFCCCRCCYCCHWHCCYCCYYCRRNVCDLNVYVLWSHCTLIKWGFLRKPDMNSEEEVGFQENSYALMNVFGHWVWAAWIVCIAIQIPTPGRRAIQLVCVYVYNVHAWLSYECVLFMVYTHYQDLWSLVTGDQVYMNQLTLDFIFHCKLKADMPQI